METFYHSKTVGSPIRFCNLSKTDSSLLEDVQLHQKRAIKCTIDPRIGLGLYPWLACTNQVEQELLSCTMICPLNLWLLYVDRGEQLTGNESLRTKLVLLLHLLSNWQD